MNTPEISVVMPVFNEQRYVALAMQSILCQTFHDLEFIIIDDGSTDGTAAILEEWRRKDKRIHVVVQENRGITKALNAGIAVAQGRFIARMDANDLSFPQRLMRQIEYLRAHPQCVAIGGAVELIDEDGDLIGQKNYSCDPEIILRGLLGKERNVGAALSHPSAMIRRESLEQVGGYREDFKAAQDRDLWLRLAEVGELSNISEVVIQRRIESDRGISAKRANIQRECAIRAISDAYDRRGESMPKVLELWPVVMCPTRRRLGSAMSACRSGLFPTARKHVWLALKRRPWSYRGWRTLARIAITQCLAKVDRNADISRHLSTKRTS